MSGSGPILMGATVAGAAGMWLMLAATGRRARWAGAALGAVALGLLTSQMPSAGQWLTDGLFFILAGVTVVAAAATVAVRNPVYAAIWFGLMLLGTAGLMLLAGAQFLAAATVVVYAGAILVTFLFVLMLANPRGRDHYDRANWEGLLSAAAGVVLVGLLTAAVVRVFGQPDQLPVAVVEEAQRRAGVLASEHVRRIGRELFGRQLIAVEVAGTLLLVALIGAAVIVGRAGPGGPKHGEGRRQ